jgi:hypothetical protein
MAMESTDKVIFLEQRLELQIKPAATRPPSGRVQNQWMCEITLTRGKESSPKSRNISIKTGAAHPIKKSDRMQRKLAMHGSTMVFFSGMSIAVIVSRKYLQGLPKLLPLPWEMGGVRGAYVSC